VLRVTSELRQSAGTVCFDHGGVVAAAVGSDLQPLGGRLVPRLPPPEVQGSEPLDLVPFEWEVLAAVDGARDLHSLAEVLGRSEFEVARTVYGLTNAGIVVLDDPAHPGQEAEPGRDLAALLVPAREALGQGQYDLAAGALEELLRADPLMPEARRLLGVCYAALGRHGEALDCWSSWSRLATRTPGEEAEAPMVERLRQSVEAIMTELERYRD
jgi:hypothetical protein